MVCTSYLQKLIWFITRADAISNCAVIQKPLQNLQIGEIYPCVEDIIDREQKLRATNRELSSVLDCQVLKKMEQRKSTIFNQKHYRKKSGFKEYAPECYKKGAWIQSLQIFLLILTMGQYFQPLMTMDLSLPTILLGLGYYYSHISN